MSAVTGTPFVARLRTGGGRKPIDLSRGAADSITVRVEIPEVWDAVRITTSANEPVVSIKRAALEALAPADERGDEYVIKLRGWEVLDEALSLSDAGAINGSIFLLTHRRRRAVK